MPAAERAFFEPRFGADLSRVRLHTGARAARLSHALEARAFTHGSDIYFSDRISDPCAGSSRRLLAHELTHVVQQSGGSPIVQRQPAPVEEFAPRGPVEQAREDVGNALLIAGNKLDQAIQNRDRDGPLPTDVYDAYTRFFAGSGLERLDLLKTRVDEARQWIQTMPFDVIPSPVPAGYRDEAGHRAVLADPRFRAVAYQPPSSADHYIAVYPPFFNDASMRAPIVLHELFHFYPVVRHAAQGQPTEPAWENARAYQGFVGTLANLPEGGGITTMFPP